MCVQYKPYQHGSLVKMAVILQTTFFMHIHGGKLFYFVSDFSEVGSCCQLDAQE